MNVFVLVRSLGRKCGMAEYAGFLAERLPGQLVASPEELPEGPGVVFVQLEYGLYNGNLQEMIDELEAVKAKGFTVVGDYASEPDAAQGWSRTLVNHCIFGPKYPEPDSVHLPLIRCSPLAEPDPGPPAELHIGTFGFAAPAKHHEDVIELGIRLGIKTTVISTVPDPWPGFEGSQSWTVPQSSLELYQRLSEGQENVTLLSGGYYSTHKVLRLLRGCSHLVSAMEDMGANWGPSGSLRTMAMAGRPLIASRSLRASEVGAVIVETLQDVDRVFLEGHREPVDPNQVSDGINQYHTLLRELAEETK